MKIKLFNPLSRKTAVILSFFILFLTSEFSFAQDFSARVRFVEPSDQFLTAGIELTSIQKTDFDNLLAKIGNSYLVTSEYTDQRSTGRISLKSNFRAGISDFESLLKQMGIYYVDYNGKKISSQDIHSNYAPVDRTEIKKIERIN